MSYEAGFFKYFVNSIIFNFVPMYIFGAGVLATLNVLPHLLDGNLVIMALDYFFTKYLPPTSLEQVFLQTGLGSFWAAIKWYVFTPRV
jgi:hypothetical protein